MTTSSTTPENPAQKQFLQRLCDERSVIDVYLVNGIRLKRCTVVSFDNHCIVLSDERGTQLAYKGAVSTIVPSRERA